ncbi:Cullin binding protein CanA [Histoplasma capsulatum G186AR]|uniref:Cullin binding protein CanA n=1 Tax=Ajellomyces capsulatus TaxID=5037 RepID=A0A8H7YXJ9_AJECA|nr:Cullin binding protein CanA [Histoplasma capsulatum]QSS73075.1 Cullin binding protein CanA [Histoplasma capsulatum G186AR]
MAYDRQATQQSLNSLLSKLTDPDPDIRYMSLNDLLTTLEQANSAYLSQDVHSCSKLVEGLLKALEDQHGEVQNQALKCLKPLVTRLPPEIVTPLIDKLTHMTASETIDTSVPNTALRIILAALPRPDPSAPLSRESQAGCMAVSKVLIPRLVGGTVTANGQSKVNGMLANDPEKGYSSEALDVLIEVVRHFGPMLNERELASLEETVMAIVENDNAGTVVIKRALTAVSALLAHFSDAQLSTFVSTLIESFRSPHLTPTRRRHLIGTIAALARSIPSKFGPYLRTLAPFVLSAVSEQELSEMRDDDSDTGDHDSEEDELRETALATLETLLGSCSSEMQLYLSDSIKAALRYLKYDPNVAEVEDEEMGGTQDEGSDDGATEEPEDDNDAFDDFEEEEGYSDIDDMSWKVRRCAAKVLYTIIATQQNNPKALEDGPIYQTIAPALLARFTKEREESVKLEAVASMNCLVRKTGEISAVINPDIHLTNEFGRGRTSRKRRRQDSDANLFDLESEVASSLAMSSPITTGSIPSSGPQAEIAKLTPSIIQNIVKLWKRASIPLKQAAISLLKSLALVRYGGLSEFLQQIEDPIADALKTSAMSSGFSVSAGTTSVSSSSLQIETLSLIAAISETHASNALLPFLIALIPGVVSAVNDKNYRVASEALGAVEQIEKALTPPRVSATEHDLGPQLEKLFYIIVDRIADNSSDLEVRQRAIHVLGVLLGRTSGAPKFISPVQRAAGLTLLVDRLRNETTRLATARAIDDIALLASGPDDVASPWVRDVTLELGTQLRKSDRALRGSCLEALKSLAINPHTRALYDTKTTQELTSFLRPLLSTDDLHLLTPTLIIMGKLIPGNAQQLIDNRIVAALCSIIQAPLVGTVLKAYLLLVRVIGEQGAGAALMQALLKDVGVSGDPAVVGRAIGTLLVYGGPNIGVKMEDFLTELQTAQDAQRKCLALAVLGEVGLRMGPACPLTPETFISNFTSKSDKVRLSAAIALGNSGARNIKAYLPVILEGLEASAPSKYLLLHSLKEILQHPESVRPDVAPFATRLWQRLLTASDDEDNRAVGAECIGRLSLIEPTSYIPLLQEYLSNENPAIRGTVISAFRYTLADSSDSYNDVLRPLIVPVLITMLNDTDLSNHRLALTTVNSAIHNKTNLIVPHLNKILPAVINDTRVNPALVREVQMGPFRHKVDDGLEVRKSAYEAVYACLEVAFGALNVAEIFDRIIAGIEDEQDVRTISNLMISKLIVLAPEETRDHLNALSAPLRKVLSTKPKENAVKQELEKAQGASLGVLKITRELQKAFPTAEASGDQRAWKLYVEWVGKEFTPLIRSLANDG